MADGIEAPTYVLFGDADPPHGMSIPLAWHVSGGGEIRSRQLTVCTCRVSSCRRVLSRKTVSATVSFFTFIYAS